MLLQYVRGGYRRKIGVMVAESIDNHVVLGWSLTSKNDKFDKVRGREIAVSRMLLGSKVAVPHSMRKQFDSFAMRANRYFQDAQPYEITISTPIIDERFVFV